jgi:hypothetical protein
VTRQTILAVDPSTLRVRQGGPAKGLASELIMLEQQARLLF